MAQEPMIADKNYYRDADHNLVDEGDPKAAFLVAGKGSEVDAATAEKYGITPGEAAPHESEGEEAPESKAAKPKAAAPQANKAASPKTNKGAKK